MAREINLVCDFFFDFVCTNLPSDMVDVELMVRMVQGIYTYRKDHTVESTIFTLWSKNMIPFPSLRRKIKAFKENNRRPMTTVWNNNVMPQFSAPSKPPKTPENMPQAKSELSGLIITINST